MYSDRNVALYTEKQYNDYGWARANDLLTAKENESLRSKFAAAVSGQATLKKSKSGEYMIPVGEGAENKIVYMKGTIDSPIITRVLEIDLYDETQLSDIRRNIYETERRGIQQETGEIFKRYNSFDFRNTQTEKRKSSERAGHHHESESDGRGDRSKTKRITRLKVNDDGTYTETYADGTQETFSSEDGDIRYQERTLAKKSSYNEFNTNAMQWAKSASRNADDLNVFYDPRRKRYVLIGVSEDSDMGFIELNSGTRLEMEREKRDYEQEYDLNALPEEPDTLAEKHRHEQGNDRWNNGSAREQGEAKTNGGLSSVGVRQGEQISNETRDSSGAETDSGGVKKQDRTPYRSARDVLLSYAEDARKKKVLQIFTMQLS